MTNSALTRDPEAVWGARLFRVLPSSPPRPRQHPRQAASLCHHHNRALASAPQLVALLASLLQSEPPDHVRLAVLDFVSSLGKLLLSQALQVITLNSVVPVNSH